MLNPIRVIFAIGGGMEDRIEFATIADAVAYLVGTGHTELDNQELSPLGNPVIRIGSRLHRGPDAYARIDTTSTPGAWLTVVSEVLDRQ